MLNKNMLVNRNVYVSYATELPKEDTYDQDKLTHLFRLFVTEELYQCIYLFIVISICCHKYKQFIYNVNILCENTNENYIIISEEFSYNRLTWNNLKVPGFLPILMKGEIRIFQKIVSKHRFQFQCQSLFSYFQPQKNISFSISS